MSTKTTFKRIALVAVAALGLGVLTSVAPATAAQQTPSLITFGTPVSAAAGTTATIPVTFQLPAGFAIGDTIVVGARVITAPATSFATPKAATPGVAAVAAETATANNFTWAKAASGSGSYHSGSLSVTYGSAALGWTAATTYLSATGDSTTSITLNLQITPDAAGSYGILAYVGNTAAAYDTSAEIASSGISTATITGALNTAATTYTTGTSATTATWTQVTPGAVTGSAATNGTIMRLALSNAAGAATLGTGENIVLSSSSSTTTFTALTDSLTNGGTTLSRANFVNGVALIRVVNTAAASESTTFTATNGGLLTSAISSAITVSWTAYSTQDAPTIAKSSTNTALTTTGANAATTTQVNYLAASTATSHSLRVTLADNAAAFKTFVSVTDTNGKITGAATAAYDQIVSLGAADTYASVSIPATLLLNEAVTVVVYSSTAAIKTATITGAVPATTTLTVTNSTRRAAAASANSILVRVTDQWGAAAANKTVTVTIAGRNSAIASTSLVSDASGYVTYTYTDAGTVGTVDTVTFASTGATSKTATINYGAYTVAGVTVEGPQTDDVAPTVTYSDIDESYTGANTTVVTFTATVADAAGIGISGVPVTFTISGTGAAIRTNTVSRVTDALGEATASVYGWVEGTYTVTATAADKSGTATVSFRQNTPASARTISATVEGNVVKALVKDRYGNPVANVPLFASRTGAGYFGTGGSTATATTGLNGVAEFIINGGDASVTVGFGTSSFVLDYGQTSDVAGKVNATTATATTAGTAITAETGVGASFTAAGVNKATVAVSVVDTAAAAADAAAEATDAANAATDAANAAAEAADAATAAAQDAADAVAALSTQVSEMVNALKKQITALTNLVIKIQKKVRA